MRIDKSNFFKYISITMLVLYLSYLLYLTFFDQLYGRDIIHRNINIIPLKTILQFLVRSFDWNGVVINIGGNIAAFIPMGFLLPIVFKRLNSLFRILKAVLLSTVLIEVFQYIIGVGITDIDDVILNVLGGILGYLLMKGIKKFVMLRSIRA